MGEFGIVVIRACARLFPDGAAVAQLTVNQRVVGSNPTRGARNLKPGEAILRVFCIPRCGCPCPGLHAAPAPAHVSLGYRSMLGL